MGVLILIFMIFSSFNYPSGNLPNIIFRAIIDSTSSSVEKIVRFLNLHDNLLCVCVCVCVCVLQVNHNATWLGVKVDQGLPCVHHHIPRSSGKPL